MKERKIKVLSYSDRLRQDREESGIVEGESSVLVEAASRIVQGTSSEPQFTWKDPNTVEPFKLIDDKDWNLISCAPSTETAIFNNGHSAINIVSVIGLQGAGKSNLMNSLAERVIFPTHRSIKEVKNFASLRHVTRGVDILATYDRILLDSQPMLSASSLDNIYNQLTPTNRKFIHCDPLTQNYMISLKLATFLIAISDFVIIVSKWNIDVHLLKLIATALLMIGDDNLKAKFIMYSDNEEIHNQSIKKIVDGCLGLNRIEKYSSNVDDVRRHVSSYSTEKCEMYRKDPFTFTGKNWLSSCQRVWEMSIKNSSMFADYEQRLLASQSE